MGLTRIEKIVFILILLSVVLLSVISKDKPIVLIAALCSITYTILAGKGKILCFFSGITGSFLYSYLSFVNSLFGSFILYAFYYIPIQIIGIFNWRKHLNKKTDSIIKTKLTKKQRLFYFSLAFILSVIVSFILQKTGDITPYKDGFVGVFSVLGQYLTLKRCIEQWYVWFFVNLLSVFIWLKVFLLTGSGLTVVFMWLVYFLLSIYFLCSWKKELN